MKRYKMNALLARLSQSKFARVAMAAAAVAMALAGVQEALRQQTHSRLAEAATFASVGTHKLRLRCTGEGHTTYLLEAGATGFAETWHWVQQALDDDARVCSYDRAGLGLSEAAPQGFEVGRTARDLRAALKAAGENGPFVVVGHSLGGFFAREFAAQYPTVTAAIVLVDASHERQLDAFSEEMVSEFRAFPGVLSALSAVSTTGLLRAWNPLASGAEGLEGDALEAAHVFAGDRVHLATSAEELSHWDAITARAANQRLREDLPVLAVTAGAPVPGSADFSSLVEPLHQDIAQRFIYGRQITLDEANHFSILMDRAHARRLSALIQNYLNEVENPS